jgi:hypothetical protein
MKASRLSSVFLMEGENPFLKVYRSTFCLFADLVYRSFGV